VTEDDLREAFSHAGQVASVKVIMDRDTGRSKGFGFVEMSSDDEAQQALEQLNGASLGGRQLTVNEARPMQPGGQNRAPRNDRY
jgi:RNA recognition motif-containing protein